MRFYRTHVLDFIIFRSGCEGLLSFDCLGQREIKGSQTGSSTGFQRCPETDFFQNYASIWGAPPPEIRMLVHVFCQCCCPSASAILPPSRASLPQFRTSPNQQKKVSIESVYAVFPFTHYFPLLPLSRAQKI